MRDSLANERHLTFGEAAREALVEAMHHDPSVFVMGEGIADPTSVFGTVKGLNEIFEPSRIVEMPVAENGLTGVAIGAAMAGKRPVINFHRVEFALLALDQLFNNAAKSHYITRGVHRVPLVVRMIVGRGWGQGPGHSQSLEAIFAQIPGLKVVMPAFPNDAKGLLLGAIADDNPVIVIEHRWTHGARGHVDVGYTPLPLDGPRRLREGSDVTLVATSYMTLEAIRAADVLKSIGVSAEVIDVRVLRPLNLDLVVDSVRRTGHLVTIDTGWAKFGIGSEIIASLASLDPTMFRRGPVRLGLPEHPIPSSRGLIGDVYPDAAKIVNRVAALLDIAAERTEIALEALRVQRGDLPIDVPDPFFKGPF